jgi:DNA-binding protein
MSGATRTIYVGRKPLMNYVLAVVAGFSQPNADRVVLKARGRAISAAVDVAEISRRRFLRDVKVDGIEIGSEDIPIREEDRNKTVSTIDITLARVSPSKERLEGEEKKAETRSQAAELTEIKGIGAKTAEKLMAHGINLVRDLAGSDPTELARDLHISEKRLAKWVDEASKTTKDQ